MVTNPGQTKQFRVVDPNTRQKVELAAGIWEPAKESTSQPDVVAWDEQESTGKPRIAVELKWAEHTSGPLVALWQGCLYLRAFDRVYIGSQISLDHLRDQHGLTAIPEWISYLGLGYLYVPMHQKAPGEWEALGDVKEEIEPAPSNRWRQGTLGPEWIGRAWVLKVLPSSDSN